MFIKLLLAFVIIPVLELTVLMKVSNIIGILNTVMVILITGVWGAYLAKSQGFQVLKRITDNLEQGNLPTEELLDGAFVLVGGALLLTPGFLTDLSGLICLIPQTRYLIKTWLRRKLEQKLASGKFNIHYRSWM